MHISLMGHKEEGKRLMEKLKQAEAKAAVASFVCLAIQKGRNF